MREGLLSTGPTPSSFCLISSPGVEHFLISLASGKDFDGTVRGGGSAGTVGLDYNFNFSYATVYKLINFDKIISNCSYQRLFIIFSSSSVLKFKKIQYKSS